MTQPRNFGFGEDETILRDSTRKFLADNFGVEALTDHPMRIPLQSKLITSELAQDIAAVALDVEGPFASLYVRDENAPDHGEWPLAYMNSYGITIAAGTSEIQRNILGERVLGLAKSK